MRPRTRRLAIALLSACLSVTTGAHAASISALDRADLLPDGSDYLEVTVEAAADGAINFTVTPMAALLALAGDSLEIRAFAFNPSPGLHLTAANVVGLPDGWSARGTTRLDGFGRFGLTLIGTGPDRTDTLTFSIVGIDGDSPENYMNVSTGNAKEGNAIFAARVRDMFAEAACDPDRKCTPQAIPTAFVGGGAVPAPAAAWLIAPAIALVVPWVKRRKAA